MEPSHRFKEQYRSLSPQQRDRLHRVSVHDPTVHLHMQRGQLAGDSLMSILINIVEQLSKDKAELNLAYKTQLNNSIDQVKVRFD